MDSTDDSRFQSLLLSVMNTSKNIFHAVAPATFTEPPPSLPVNPPALPPPPDVLPELQAAGAPASMIAELLKWYNRECRSLRRQAEAVIATLPTPSTRNIHVFEAVYMRKVSALKNHMLQRVRNFSTKRASKFNQVRRCCLAGFLQSPISLFSKCCRNLPRCLRNTSKIMLTLPPQTARCWLGRPI